MNQQGFAPIILILILVVGGFFVATKILPKNNTTPLLNQEKGSSDSVRSSSSSATTSRPAAPAATNKPVKLGSIKGKVVGGYYSRGLANATVTAKGEIQKTVSTDSAGNFTVADLPVGKYTLSFSHPDYINFADWKDFEVEERNNYLNRTPNGFLKDFKPTTIKGTVFVDRDGNNQKDSGDEGLDAGLEIYNKVGDSSWNLYQNVQADKSGNFSVSIKDVSTYKVVPLFYTFFNKPSNEEQFVVDGYGEAKEYSFAYYPTASQAKFDILVFNDKNENSVQDTDEEYIDFYYAEVTNTTTGKSYKTSVSAQTGGGKGNPVTDYGVYKVKLIPGDDSWAYYYKVTKSEDIATVGNNTGDVTIKLGAHKLN
ncbi:hypothetical protein A3I48_02115 [Candidatus Daviesbacteria bacterium RIFCSPLOWO2_02_FULL_36_7]|uniref:SD-repeat containing protein B domain-containing protein n=1 Tax=Candidatus Daviesbacteria bacterium RIFCSPLOWO2_02_FULL_36_7 TaxID=1797792 RepID=A0A1F5MI24_9BACT|nr:MAG: hypothetical protein A3I48_02115 [Candidatus Daviesbacteria bacterium RIFCSPLOWO2_02_FULL_36_7]